MYEFLAVHVYRDKYLDPYAFRVCVLWLILAISQVLKAKYNFSLTFASVLRYGRELIFIGIFPFLHFLCGYNTEVKKGRKKNRLELCTSLIHKGAMQF